MSTLEVSPNDFNGTFSQLNVYRISASVNEWTNASFCFVIHFPQLKLGKLILIFFDERRTFWCSKRAACKEWLAEGKHTARIWHLMKSTVLITGLCPVVTQLWPLWGLKWAEGGHDSLLLFNSSTESHIMLSLWKLALLCYCSSEILCGQGTRVCVLPLWPHPSVSHTAELCIILIKGATSMNVEWKQIK